ncbi:hypothetical protein Rsub_04687 [Raphidocelis subcapitata]|uniref:Golgi apparatus 1 n=1 Tax=Raphidocelis subcapitata TaxID=307507 RepID=A0A2V0P2A2_9CHLO|nr:hypothetical protein Rsub_04687 [Raphidocelis subcapitata]|eukprot:GBF91963.1 hypothetical protein Rsub_04687 [Raphidocelis subcapitata]
MERSSRRRRKCPSRGGRALVPLALLLAFAAAAADAAASTGGRPAARRRLAGDEGAAPVGGGGSVQEVQLVDLAPKVNVTNGGDIDPKGACAAEAKRLCETVEAGEGRLADCVGDVMQGEDEDDDAGASAVIGDGCREAVLQFRIDRNRNINSNIPLARACAADVKAHCNSTWFFGYREGSLVSCLKMAKDKLKPECRNQVHRSQLDASYDYRADPMLHEACGQDAAAHCKGVKPGGGRVQACLMSNRIKLGWDCEEQLFKKEMEDADDVRLSVRLFRKCLPDKRTFCDEVPPGNAMAKECLEEHRQELSAGCREEIDAMIERRVRDFRLDSRLRKYCRGDIFSVCAYLGDLGDSAGADGSVINCLQDYSAELASDECRAQVKKYKELASQDIRFDAPLADACYSDRQALCAGVPPGSAAVVRCLESRRGELSPACRATLFDEEVRFSENIDFQFPMKKACKAEMEAFCASVPHGHARVIRCLQEHKQAAGFGRACRDEVERYEQTAATDYRLNFRLAQACKSDAPALCGAACGGAKPGEVCGGKVLACLADKQEQIEGEECRKEVLFFTKMEVQDFRVNLGLAEACRADIDAHCAGVEPGAGRVPACLAAAARKTKLSPACAAELERVDEMEADDVTLDANLLQLCRAERDTFCGGVSHGEGRVFRCLAENMGSADFGPDCQAAVAGKLQKREGNWRLDPPLRRACRGDVDRLCASDAVTAEPAAVKRCMVSNAASLGASCRRELGRSLHMSLFVWQPEGPVTGPCDADVQRLCLAAQPALPRTPGAVGACLKRAMAEIAAAEQAQELAAAAAASGGSSGSGGGRRRRLLSGPAPAGAPAAAAAAASAARGPAAAGGGAAKAPPPPLAAGCRALLDLAEPPPPASAFDDSAAVVRAAVAQLDRLQRATGLPVLAKDARGGAAGVTLTGWSALLGVAAVAAALAGGAALAWRRWAGPRAGYTLVMKAAPQQGGPHGAVGRASR